MPDSIRVRDLIEILERIEDKNSYVRLRVENKKAMLEMGEHDYDINNVVKLYAMEYAITST